MWQVDGQDHATRQLEAALESERLSHAYLLVGLPHVGKGTLAMNLAQAVNCLSKEGPEPCGQCSQCRRIAAGHHADVQVISLDQGDDNSSRREIGIDQIRALERQAHLRPYEGTWRVFIFDGAEAMSEEASNALLKTLEEPPPQTLLLLLTSQEHLLLPTLISRCRRLELRPMPREQVARYLIDKLSTEEERAQMVARLSKGCLGWAIQAVKNSSVLDHRAGELERAMALMGGGLEQRFNAAADVASLYFRDRRRAMEVLNTWLGWWRDLLLIREGAQESVYNWDYLETLKERAQDYSPRQMVRFIGSILSTLRALEHNANPRLSLEVMMLSMPNASTTTPRE